MRLPKDKLEDFTEMLNSWSIKTRATEHELSVLAGKLLYACNVIFAGRLFLNRCFAIKRFASRFDQPIYLSEDFFADISWWQCAIKTRNGISFLVPESTVHVSLDASTNGWFDGKPGLGGYNHVTHEYFSCPPIPEFEDLEIADLELLAHIISIRLWSDAWKHKQVTMHTDKEACFWLLTKGRSRKDIRLRMSRWIATQQICKEFRVTSKWIPTSENNLADALSRMGDPAQRKKFQDYCNDMGGVPMSCHVTPEMFNFESKIFDLFFFFSPASSDEIYHVIRESSCNKEVSVITNKSLAALLQHGPNPQSSSWGLAFVMLRYNSYHRGPRKISRYSH